MSATTIAPAAPINAAMMAGSLKLMPPLDWELVVEVDEELGEAVGDKDATTLYA